MTASPLRFRYLRIFCCRRHIKVAGATNTLSFFKNAYRNEKYFLTHSYLLYTLYTTSCTHQNRISKQRTKTAAMVHLPPQVDKICQKIDAFMVKYPSLTQYGACINRFRNSFSLRSLCGVPIVQYWGYVRQILPSWVMLFC